jgi:hypothetical protein
MAVATAARRASVKGRVNMMSVGEPASFHLTLILGSEYVLPVGKNSVDVLRSPFQRAALEGAQDQPDAPAFRLIHTNSKIIQSKPPNTTGTKMELWVKKFVSSQSDSEDFDKAWQDRLLITTEKRIFIVTKKNLNSKFGTDELINSKKKSDHPESSSRLEELEIVDSIPTDEILSVSLSNDHAGQSDEVEPIQASLISRSLRRAASKLNILPSHSNDKMHGIHNTSNRAERESADQCLDRFSHLSLESDTPSSSIGRENYCEPILRIATAPAGFNRGQTYHFLLRKQDYPCVEGDDAVSLRNRADAEALAARLSTLAARRRVESDRETRFLRLQRRLRSAWDSIPFNIAVLVLIVSNFAFTVEQLQNIDSARQSFYEQIDLAYTIIFALGPPNTAKVPHLYLFLGDRVLFLGI